VEEREVMQKAKEERPLRNCPAGNFREEPDCRGIKMQKGKSVSNGSVQVYSVGLTPFLQPTFLIIGIVEIILSIYIYKTKKLNLKN
jgi:hypothetical protein